MTARRRPSRQRGTIACLLLLSGGLLSAQEPTFEPIATIPGPATLVEIHEGHAYVTHHSTLTVYDLSDPRHPQAVGSLTVPEEIWGFRINDDRIYIGANFHGLVIADISDPSAPQVIGVFKSLGQTKIGAVFGSKVGLIDHMEGFVLVDVTDESAPASSGSFFLDGYARDVVTSGSFAYATDSPSGLYVFDLSTDGPPEPIAVLHAPSAPRSSLGITELTTGTRILAGIGGPNLQLFDVTDPSAPMKVADFDTPGTANAVALDGPLAYVADGAAGVQVFDLSVPAAPRLTASFPTDRPARDVATSDEYLLVVVGDSEREGENRDILVVRRTDAGGPR